MRIEGVRVLGEKESPSHAVGLERIATSNGMVSGIMEVSIPHSGLRTHSPLGKIPAKQVSPSHTVGLEPQLTILIKIR